MNKLRRISRFLRLLAWHMGGQKRHLGSGKRLSAGAHVANSVNFIFPDSIHLGTEVLILPGAHLICSSIPPYLCAEGVIRIGDRSIIREGAILHSYGGVISIGCDCTVNPYCLFQGNGGIKIGDNVLIASHVSIFSANHIFDDEHRSIRSQGETRLGVEIQDDVWIGSGAKILDGVRIGRGSVIAAGAVVNRDVPSNEIFGGVPARMIGKRGK